MAARGQVSSGASVEGNADQLCNGTVARAASLHRNFVCYQRCSIALERWFIRHVLASFLVLVSRASIPRTVSVPTVVVRCCVSLLLQPNQWGDAASHDCRSSCIPNQFYLFAVTRGLPFWRVIPVSQSSVLF